MSAKLDQSLDEILSTRKTPRGRGRGRRAPTAARINGAAAAAPVGGIQKTARSTRASARAVVPTGPTAGSGESKVIVSNLPYDVSETQIKEYFVKSVGPVKRVLITYGPNGTSRGIATVIFNKSTSANDALSLHGLLVDGKPMKIEVVLDATRAPPPAPVKTLSDRIAQPKKAQPKPATATKATTDGSVTRGGRVRGRGGRRGRVGRGKPKTAEELDAEMVDYFDANAANGTAAAGGDAAATTNGATQPATTNGGGDTGMDDEIL
ncbi:MAG: hypothetical protein M1836_007562 [Candelina mexicana]|nr:MAG: hypothetical protein M1836_007562 [Candelina mexicana]